MRLQSAGNVMHQKRAEDFGDFEKVRELSWVPALEEDGWLSGLAEARRICVLRVPHVLWGQREKPK